MIKTAIFDFDGTLADTIPLCREAFRRAIRKLDGRILTDEEIERANSARTIWGLSRN